MTEKNRRETANLSVNAFIREKTKEYYGRIALLALLSLVTACLSLGFSYSAKYIVNSAETGKNVALAITVSLTLLLSRILLGSVYNYGSSKLRARIVKKLRNELFSDVVNADALKMGPMHSGELINRFTSDVNEVASDTVYIIPTAVGVVARLVGTLALLFVVDAAFALIFLVGSLLTMGVVALYRKKIRRYRKETLETDGAVRSFVQESVSASVTVKAYNAEKNVIRRETGLDDAYYRAVMKRNLLNSVMSGVYSLIGNAGLIFSIIYFGVGGALSASVDYGAALTVILLLLGVQQPINSLSAVVSARYTLSVSASRLKEVSDIEKTPADKSIIDDFEYIELKNVGFSYGTRETLKGLSFSLKKGEKVCVYGDSGQGKTTFFKLLAGVYAPQTGEVLVASGGKTYSPEEVAGLFAYVPQGNYLFSGSVYENVAFFCSTKPREEEVRKALEIAEADFVYSLKDGLDTRLTERGGGLSEGQTQRLAIARAVLSAKPIILFDEATSALDEATEEKILSAVCALKDKTCVFISHRPKAAEKADRVVKIEDGAFVAVAK